MPATLQGVNETWHEDATTAPTKNRSEGSQDWDADDSAREGPSLAVLASALGLTEAERTLYAHLLEEDLPAHELSARIGIPPKAVTSLLRSLTAKGLVRRLEAGSPRFGVIAPDAALPALLRQREAELENAREAAKRLAQSHARRLVGGQADRDDYVEIVFGNDALKTQIQMLESRARSEICVCTKLPIILFPVEGEEPEEEEEDALRRGVSVRALYEEPFLELPGAANHIREVMSAGEQSRVLPTLPSKLSIFDRSALVVATELTAEGAQLVGVVMHHPELVTTLQALFDLMWQAATPMPQSVGVDRESVDDGSDDETLILCLAAGMKDASIARQLGLSHRTVARRVGRLQDRLRATSRFQAGYRLGLETAQAGSDQK